MLLFGNPKFSDNVSSGIIHAVIKFIESTNRFNESNITPTIIFFISVLFSQFTQLFFKLI